jgi:hypothetical protein
MAAIANRKGTEENESGNGGAHDGPPAPYEPHSAPVLTLPIDARNPPSE